MSKVFDTSNPFIFPYNERMFNTWDEIRRAIDDVEFYTSPKIVKQKKIKNKKKNRKLSKKTSC